MRRSPRRFAALLTALVLAVSPLLLGAPAATASPSDTSTGDTIVLVPAGTNPNRQQLEDIARRMLDDPLGRVLYSAWVELAGHPFKPINISAGIFRFDWMATDRELPEWVRNGSSDFLIGLRNEIAAPSSQPAKEYPVRAQLTSADVALHDRLRIPASPYDPELEPLLVLATSNAWSGHSEVNMLEWLQRAFRDVLTGMARTTAEHNAVDATVKAVIAKSGAGFAGQRTFCSACDVTTAKSGLDFPHELAIAYYDAEGTNHADLAGKIINGGELFSILRDQYTGLADSAAATVQQDLGLTQPCPPVNAAQQLPQSKSMSMSMSESRSDPCDKSGSGLAQALGSSTYGGVDFSSLQLRYMSDDPGTGVKYAFSAGNASAGLAQNIGTGLNALTDSAADLRTWLVLDPKKFWVNLNPTEPDRIVDTALGQTAAGRALLDADLQMKRTAGELLDPSTPFGAQYWKALGDGAANSCYSSRLWIVPGDVEVRQDGSSLYVLKANLNVKSQAMQVNGLGRTACNTNPQQTARNEQLENTMVVPKVAQAINAAPEYAPLRQAFLARVVAQWIRDRHADGQTTSFDKLIDSGDLGPAKLRGGWSPRQVYDAYVHSIQSGDFTYHQTIHVGSETVTYVLQTGGVDFSAVNSTKLSAAQMDKLSPGLSQTVNSSIAGPAPASDGSIWLGEAAGSRGVSLWSRISTYTGGRTGLLVILLVALGAVLFLVRDGSALRRRKA